MAEYHVHQITYGSRWAVRKHGNVRASKSFLTKARAIAHGSSICKPGDRLWIHARDGTVEKFIDCSGEVVLFKIIHVHGPSGRAPRCENCKRRGSERLLDGVSDLAKLYLCGVCFQALLKAIDLFVSPEEAR